MSGEVLIAGNREENLPMADAFAVVVWIPYLN
jgi:hypothetical protein